MRTGRFTGSSRSARFCRSPCRPTAPHVAQQADPAKQSTRTRSDAALMIEIRRVFEANFCVYGVRKVWRQLRREDIEVARCTVARLMHAMGLQGIVRGRKVRTTVPDPAAVCPLDRVNRQFKALCPNALWVSDFTYVATWAGFVYVAASGGGGAGCFADGSPSGDRHRRLCPSHRRLARVPLRPGRLSASPNRRARRAGAGAAPTPASPERPPRTSQR